MTVIGSGSLNCDIEMEDNMDHQAVINCCII